MKYTGEVLKDLDEQTRRWVAGESLHSDHRGLGPECCPDFSCCRPELLQPPEVRRAFQVASPEEQQRWCMVFLGEALATAFPEVNVHITDGNPQEPS